MMDIYHMGFWYFSYMKQKNQHFFSLHTASYCVTKRHSRNFRCGPNYDCAWKIIPVGDICIIFTIKRTKRYQVQGSCMFLSWNPEIIPMVWFLYTLYFCGSQKVIKRVWSGVGKCLWYTQRESCIHSVEVTENWSTAIFYLSCICSTSWLSYRELTLCPNTRFCHQQKKWKEKWPFQRSQLLW